MQSLQQHNSIKELLRLSFESIYRDVAKRGLLIQYYSQEFNDDKDLCATCRHKIQRYYNSLQSKFNQKSDKMSKFSLKKDTGSIPMTFGSSKFISNANITDELAIEFLKNNPNRSIVFETLPDNWEELIAEGDQEAPTEEGPTEEAPTEDSKLTLTQLKDKYPGITSNSKEGFLNKLAEASKQ